MLASGLKCALVTLWLEFDASIFQPGTVGNIPFGITDDDLKAVFQDVGPVKSLR